MSGENVDVVVRLFDAVARRDSATVMSLYHPDIVWDGSRSRWAEVMSGEPRWQGHEGLRTFFRRYYETWELFEDKVGEVIDAGDEVVVIVNSKARGRSSGVDVEWRDHAGVMSIRDGMIARVVWFESRDEALEAVGLSE